MTLVLLLAAAGLMLLPGLARRPLSHLRPAESAKLQVLGFLSGMTSLGLGLALCATPLLFDLFDISPIGLLGAQHFFPGGPIAGWVSLALLLVLLGAGLAAVGGHIKTQRQLRTEAAYGKRTQAGGATVHVLPTQLPLAFALASYGGSVVVSQGVIERLDRAQLDAVIRHEMSHLSHHHHWYLLVADLVERVFGTIPAVSRSTGSLRLAIEKWADDDTILVPGDRILISTAMRLLVGLPAGPTVPAFAQADLLARRLQHLEGAGRAPSLASRVLSYAATIAGLAGAIGSLLFWAI